MTIIVGILCSDGVVIGTDSSATFAAGTEPTVEQKMKKIDLIDDRCILAGTGQVGLGQRFLSIVETYSKEKGFDANTPAIQVVTKLCAQAVKNFVSTNVPRSGYGALLAFPLGRDFHLCEFQLADFQPELKTATGLWYGSMGSGQKIVDPFLALMRSVFWKDQPPPLNEGVFATTWALKHVIDVNPGGINGPKQIALLERDNKGKPTARLLTDHDIAEHDEMAEGVIRHLEEYRKIIHGGGGPQIPEK